MKVIYGIGRVNQQFVNPVVVIGVFDGVHLGHQKLIRKAVERAHAIKGKAIVLTFDPHPFQVLHPHINLSLICSLSHRLKLIQQLGVDACVVIRFNKTFSRLSPQQFVEKYLFKYIHPKEIFVGDDFRFGKDRSGTLDLFKQMGSRYGFKINNVHHRLTGSQKIGSSTIRELISRGELKKAKMLLGRDVCILGIVKRGDRRGKSLGYPTANLYPQHELLPPYGVYAVEVQWHGQILKGMANIGVRPSFKNVDHSPNIEVHIFDFQQNLYGCEIVISFIKKIRPERKFKTKQELIRQLERDEQRVRKILK